jgi:tetratricopeptide (TPR) repeat protein/TolB-like protein
MKQRHPRLRAPLWTFGAVLFLFISTAVSAQSTSSQPAATRSALTSEGIYLVFPFERVNTTPRLEWISEGMEELTIQRLSAARQQVYSHSGRLSEMDLYGMPGLATLSRATMLRMAQEMDADFVVFGNFTSDGKNITVNARILRVHPVELLPTVQVSGPLESLLDLHARLVWMLLSSTDRNYPLSLAEFSKLLRPLNPTAFEQYIRGLIASEDDSRIRYLKEAARIEPDWPEPAYALGELYFVRDDCNSALPWFSRVPVTHDRSAEALFSIGVCRLRLAQPDKAEELFSALQDGLRHNMVSGADVPEILNNLALARARQGNVAAAQTALARAADIDPSQDDYPFNLGLLYLGQNEYALAAAQFREAMHREPDNPEDAAFLIYAVEKQGNKETAAQERENAAAAFGPNGLPAIKIDSQSDSLAKRQRIVKELDTTTLRLELQGAGLQTAASAESAVPKESAVSHVRRGRQELTAGRVDSAEREFQAAIAVDPKSAAAHRELADIYRRRGKLDDAVKELQLSLAASDSAAARTTLARVYLDQKKPDLALAEVQKAVKLAPNFTEAKELLEHLEKTKQPGGAQ